MKESVRRATLEDVDPISQVHYLAHVETYTGHFPQEIIADNPPERRSRMWHRIIGEHLGDRPASLWVFDENARAIKFYKKNGFTSDGEEKVDPVYGNIREIRLIR